MNRSRIMLVVLMFLVAGCQKARPSAPIKGDTPPVSGHEAYLQAVDSSPDPLPPAGLMTGHWSDGTEFRYPVRATYNASSSYERLSVDATAAAAFGFHLLFTGASGVPSEGPWTVTFTGDQLQEESSVHLALLTVDHGGTTKNADGLVCEFTFDKKVLRGSFRANFGKDGLPGMGTTDPDLDVVKLAVPMLMVAPPEEPAAPAGQLSEDKPDS